MLMDKEPDDITPADVKIENTEPTPMKVYAQKDVDREWQFLQDIKAGSQHTWQENQMARFRGDVPEKGMSYTWKRKPTQTDSTIIFNLKNAEGISRASDTRVLLVSLPAFASLNVAWVSGRRDEFGCDGRRRGQGPPAADRPSDEGHRLGPERRHEPEGAAVRRRARACAPFAEGSLTRVAAALCPGPRRRRPSSPRPSICSAAIARPWCAAIAPPVLPALEGSLG